MIRTRNARLGSRTVGKRVRALGNNDDTVDLPEGVSRVGAGVLMVLAALIGVWGILCLASGIRVCGGVSALAAKWLASILGG